MDKDKLIEIIREQAVIAGSQKALALKIGVTPAYLGDILHGRREPGHKILSALGLRKVVTYEDELPS